MEKQATYEDVNLILRLYEMRREEKLRKARGWFMQSYKVKSLAEHQALCTPGSDADAYFRMVVTYWDMVASFITAGVLHPELFFQSGNEMLFTWERAKDTIQPWRDAFGNSSLMRNLETVAAQQAAYMEKRSPGAYPAFSKRVRGES